MTQDYTGLSSKAAQEKLAKDGLNQISIKKQTSLLTKFVKEFSDVMIIALIIASIIAILNGEYLDGVIIIAIVLINATISFVQQYRAEKSLAALQNLVTPKAKVLRDDKWQLISSEEIVVNDIVKVESGDRINADGKLLEAKNIYAQESILTGESLPINKNLNDSVFMGTEVTNGFGIFEVTATGLKTEFGRIADLTQTADSGLSPLQKEVKRIGSFVTKLAFGIAAILFIIQLIKDPSEPLSSQFLFATSVAVAAVPEGLPATITIALALGVDRLAKKKAIVKRLSSAETLGSTSCIITDKTGTLTKNEMTVKEIAFTNQKLKVTGSGFNSNGELSLIPNTKILEPLQLINQYCQTTTVNFQDKKAEVVGDPTEAALIILGKKIVQQTKIQLASFNESDIIPFDSQRKMMSVRITNQTTSYNLSKGAPESILPLCTYYLDSEGNQQKITPEISDQLNSELDQLNAQAYRTLAYAFNQSEQLEEANLVFVGFISMIDPPRTEVKSVINKAHQAGIKIIVATGDHPATAKSIAQTLGIVGSEVKIITHEDLKNLDSEVISDLIKQENVIFARVNPEDKLKLVKAAQSLKHVVAVTGDGVNDAPALKQADIGVAMGIAGTDVSKEAADTVLTDDRFTTIVSAIKEGRLIYTNLRKIVFYLLSSNIGELVAIFLALLVGLPLPLTAVLLLLVNVGTDALPAISLSIDHNEEDLLNKPPRKPEDHMLSPGFATHFFSIGIAIGFITLGSYLSVLYSNNWHWGDQISSDLEVKAITAAFVTLVLVQFFNAFNASSLSSSIIKWRPQNHLPLIISNVATLAVVIALTEVPVLQETFKLTSLSARLWLIVFCLSFSIVIINELFKHIFHGSKQPQK